jgi:hypothetical protein
MKERTENGKPQGNKNNERKTDVERKSYDRKQRNRDRKEQRKDDYTNGERKVGRKDDKMFRK